MKEPLLSNVMLFAATLPLSLAIAFYGCKRSGTPPGVAAPGLPTAPVAAPVSVAPVVPPPARVGRTEDERNTIGVFRSTAASAVFVTQQQVVVDYFGGTATEVPAGSGSGFVWDKKGHVVTNFHVVDGARSLIVALQDQRKFPARVVGGEPRKDIAVLKIDAPADVLTPVVLPEREAELEVGQKVIAIGNPFGLDHTVTTGIVSAVGREVPGAGGVTIRDMIQTDAAINPGNSGGPLIDSSGKLIGMNTMIFSRSGSSAGIGFAVPVASIARVVPQIIATGRAEQVGLGVRIDPQRRLERRYGLKGVAIIGVEPNSPAAKAGLRGMTQSPTGLTLGDVIVRIDDKDVKSYDDLYSLLDRHKVGDKVDVQVRRGDKLVTIPIELVLVR
jgi:S1-C subfamily serine protease